jgi:hypothetical protein
MLLPPRGVIGKQWLGLKLIVWLMQLGEIAGFLGLVGPYFLSRASQFSRYLLEKTGIPDRDKNARLNTVKFIKPKFGS